MPSERSITLERTRQATAAVLVDLMEIQDIDGCLPCPIGLWSLVRVLLGEATMKGVHTHASVIRRYPDTVRKMLHFLMRPRTAEVRHALANLPFTEAPNCLCAQNDTLWANTLLRAVHPIKGNLLRLSDAFTGKSALQCALQVAIEFAVGYVDVALIETPRSTIVRRALDANQRGGMLPWPYFRADVLPYGTEESIRSLCAWVEFLPHIMLLDLIITINGQVILPASPSILLETIVPMAYIPIASQHLDGRSSLDGLYALYLLPTSLATLSNRQLRVIMGGNLESLRPLVDIFRKFADMGLAQNSSLVDFEMCYVMAERLATLLEYPDDGPPPTATVPSSITNYMAFLTRGVVCGCPGCGRTPFAIGRSLHACGGCVGIYYCSRRCQKAAWRHAVLPHKAVCATLRALSKVYIKLTNGKIRVEDDKVATVLEECPVDLFEHLDGLYIKEYVEGEIVSEGEV